jgi:hypothetical protein
LKLLIESLSGKTITIVPISQEVNVPWSRLGIVANKTVLSSFITRFCRDCSLGIDTFFEQVKQYAGGEVGEFFGLTVSLPPQAGQITAQTVVVALYGKRVRLALEVSAVLEDDPVGVPEVGTVDDVFAMRKLRVQAPGRLGSTIAQRPSADFLGSTINSPPQPARLFFLNTYVHNASASTHSISDASTAPRTLPSTCSSTQFMTALWLTPTRRSVARKPTPSK